MNRTIRIIGVTCIALLSYCAPTHAADEAEWDRRYQEERDYRRQRDSDEDSRRITRDAHRVIRQSYRESDADERRRHREDAALYELNLRRNRR